MKVREVIRWTVGLAAAALFALAIAPAASAQNGFPAAKAAVDQYEPPPPPPPPPPNDNGNGGNNGNGNAGNKGDDDDGKSGNRRPSRGNGDDGDGGKRRRCTRTNRKNCPAGGAGPDADSGGPGGGGVRSERGGPLPIAEAQGGRLPFTGLSLLMVASLGALLLAAGFGVRAAARARPRRG